MRTWTLVSIVFMTVLVPVTCAGQDNSLIPVFSQLVIRKHDNAQLAGTFTREGDSLTMKIGSKTARPNDGWAGVCLENRAPVNLSTYTEVSLTVEASAPVVMDVKLEKVKAAEGTVMLADKETFARGKKTYAWKLKDASGESTAETLAATKRLCAFVLPDDFPSPKELKGAKDVTVTLSRVRFDRK